jgi:choline dehydrogenase-like flavoprotein
MALRVLGQTSSSEINLSASVCIIGAGIAGLIAGTRLARNRQLRIVILESGLKNFDDAISALNEIDNPSNNFQGALTGRFRGLGGTSVPWSGKLLPLSRHDALPRPYLGLAGWPFDVAELDPYQKEIESFIGVDSESYEEDVSECLDPDLLLPRNDVDLTLRWPKRPTPKNHNLAYVFRKEIETLNNLEIWLGSTVSAFDFDWPSGNIKTLKAINHAGQTLRVVADEYLIAAGTLESTRLLLLADRQSDGSISRGCDVLGRYFNDHLGLNVATLHPWDQTLTNRALSDRSTFSSLRHLHFELRPNVQKKNGIGSAYFDIGVELPDFSSLTKSKELLLGLKRGQLNFSYSDIEAICLDAPSLFWTMQWQWMRKQKYWPPNAKLQMKMWVEQVPKWQNRICLSDQTDTLQIPMLRLEWEKTDEEEKTIRMALEKIDHYWSRHLSHVSLLKWNPEVLNPEVRLVDLTEDQCHPAGSTRMGMNPSDSIVDPHLRVHRISNLSVASASTFPSSGSANPTLTIMQLAMRAADGLAIRNRSINL